MTNIITSFIQFYRLRLLYSLCRMKWIIVQIVNNNNRNNLGEVWKRFSIEYLNGKICLLKSMVIAILLGTEIVKFLKTLHPVLIAQMTISQIKILNEINL